MLTIEDASSSSSGSFLPNVENRNATSYCDKFFSFFYFCFYFLVSDTAIYLYVLSFLFFMIFVISFLFTLSFFEQKNVCKTNYLFFSQPNRLIEGLKKQY